MKILKIFGIVVAVHAAAFMFVFAIPGCRSTTRRAPSPAETTTSGGDQKVYYPGLTGYSTTTPPDTAASPPVSNAELNPGIVSAPVDFNASPVQPAESSGVRFNPTRPNTPTASALQATTAADVQRVTTYTIAPRDSLWEVARKHGITVAELSAANNLQSNAVLPVGKKLVIPAKAPAPAQQTGGISGDTMTYTVKSGDNLGVIARRSGTTVGAIRTLNKLKNDNVIVGQKLVLPASADTAAALAATPAAAKPRASSDDTEHVVQPNETLSQIARRYGVTQRAIGAANHISDPGKLTAGQRLIIPGAGKTNTAPSAAPAPASPPVPSAPPPTPDASPIAPSSPVSAPDSNPISAPADQPPVVPVEGASPIAPAQS